MSDPFRPVDSQAWTPVSRERAQVLMRTDTPTGSYDVQFKRFVGTKGWQDITTNTQHETRTRYRARKFNWP